MSKFLTPPVWYDKNGDLNDMLTGEASENGVAVGSGASATMGGVAVGYNAGADDEGVAIGHNANTRGGIAIGGDATEGGVAIQGTATGNSIAIGGTAAEGGIAIGGAATGNGIAIGGNAAGNEVQLGNTGVAYNLTVGDGSGTLKIGGIAGAPKIGSIAFNEMTIASNKITISAPGVYLCCTTYKKNPQEAISTSNVAICFINAVNEPAAVLSSNGSCSYVQGTSTKAGAIQAGDGFTIRYCFKIVSL